jgi:hypothetical protein
MAEIYYPPRVKIVSVSKSWQRKLTRVVMENDYTGHRLQTDAALSRIILKA